MFFMCEENNFAGMKLYISEISLAIEENTDRLSCLSGNVLGFSGTKKIM